MYNHSQREREEDAKEPPTDRDSSAARSRLPGCLHTLLRPDTTSERSGNARESNDQQQAIRMY